MRDFTLDIYRLLLSEIRKAGYSFYTFEEYCRGKAVDKYVILRHDVDLKAANSLATARIEAEMGIRATYYFRVVPQSNVPGIIREIAALGHEIGYHYEDVAFAKGVMSSAIEHFKAQLFYFRGFYPVSTVCMHGSPLSEYDNRSIWNHIDYHDFGIVGEPYFDFLNREDVIYFTDTARMWDGDRYNARDKSMKEKGEDCRVKAHSTADLMRWFEKSDNKRPVMITTHPQRWANNTGSWYMELIKQTLKNQVKRILISIRNI